MSKSIKTGKQFNGDEGLTRHALVRLAKEAKEAVKDVIDPVVKTALETQVKWLSALAKSVGQ